MANAAATEAGQQLGAGYRYARRVERMKSSAIREILKVTERPDVISFAGGLPAPELFPLDEFRNALGAATHADPSALQYSSTEGYGPLRCQIAERLKAKGIDTNADEILLTNGSQQGLDLVSKLFVDPGDVVAVESPSYLGALQVFDSYEAEFAAVSTDGEGIVPEALAETLRRQSPKLVYLTPTFKNPTGITISEERRRRIMRLVTESGALLIEDDPYGDLRYSGTLMPSIKSLDSDGRVIYLGSFSKIVAPGLRLGWICAPRDLVAKLVLAKQGTDLHTGTLIQRAMHRYLADNDVAAHIARICGAYGHRRDVMLQALTRSFPGDVKWTEPEGGMFVWVELPFDVDTTSLLSEAVANKVAYVPGEPFFPNAGTAVRLRTLASACTTNCLRLNFSNSDPSRIETGIERLAAILKPHL